MYARSAFQYLNEQAADEAFGIAWYFLKNTREIADEFAAQAIIATEIIRLLERGERHRILLANRAITAFERTHPDDVDNVLSLDFVDRR